MVGSVKRASAEYPVLLNKVPDAPDPLYYLGDYQENLFTNTLAVVGSRAVTLYGEWVINTIVKEVARNGITIVSGFMYGVDALAHRAALDVEGSTIAVMAGGIEYIFPKYQEQLYLDIVARGLVVSEFFTQSELGKWMFAKRNRIVAGLAFAVLVVEAAQDSGSLLTARYARQYGRQLMTVPANLTSANAVGTTQLLREGAKLVTCADDILTLYTNAPDNSRRDASFAVNKRLSLPSPVRSAADYCGAGDPQSVLELLKLEPLSSDELTARLLVASADVLKCLTGLVLTGQVLEREGRYYAS
jgi:DNA processing protein